MRIALSSICRGHIFALASRLAEQRQLAQLYCAYPRFKMRREQVPQNLIANFPWVHTPYMALRRFAIMPRWAERAWSRADYTYYGNYVARNLVDADIFHGLSCHNLRPGILAQQRGARYVCDRGSSHIVYQDRIMREESERIGFPLDSIDPQVIESELAEYAACDRVFVPSSFARRTFIESGISAKKIWMLPYGVSVERWQPVPVPSDGRFRVVFLGSLSLRKGIHDLLSAFEIAAIPNSELVLIGMQAPETRHLLSLHTGITNVTITGLVPHPKVLEWFSRSSVFVLPSIEDGFGLVLMEAQACGLPVIATENSGGPDVIVDGCNGFIVPIRAPETIAQRLIELYKNRGLLEAMKLAAVEKGQRVQGWNGFGNEMQRLYRALLEQR